jgi:hypothetical protein
MRNLRSNEALPDMAKKESSQKQKTATEVIGYPERPTPGKYIAIVAAAWIAWAGFLLAMAYIRHIEWPWFPT